MSERKAPIVIALDLGGTNCRGEALRWDGERFSEPLAAASLPTPSPNGDAVVETIADVVARIREALTQEQQAEVYAVGVGVPGVIDTESGFVIRAVNLGWINRDVRGELEEKTGKPVVITHDVTSAGVAEQEFGSGKGASDVLSIFLGTGIAATVTVDGKIVKGGTTDSGFRQPAGEIGHMPIVIDGLRCACGQSGCLEMYCSARSFGRQYNEALGIDPSSYDAKTSHDLFVDLETSEVARDVWSKATRFLAHGLLMATTVFGPSRIVLGGGLSAAGQTLVSSVKNHFDQISTVFETPEIVTAQLGQRAGVLGVALLTCQRLAD